MIAPDEPAAVSEPSRHGTVVRIVGEGRWLVPPLAAARLRAFDDAITRAVDEYRDDEYDRQLAGLCSFIAGGALASLTSAVTARRS